MLDQAELIDRQREALRADVIAGLSQPRKVLPSRWLYDDRGSELFEEITGLDEYYPTRTETAILRSKADEISAFCGAHVTLLEYGAGAGIKTEILLEALREPALYVPIDISGDFLSQSARRIESRFPALEVVPVTADFTTDFDLPADVPSDGLRCGFFPGSTIGNLDAADTDAFLRRMRRHAGPGGRAVVGIDLKKELGILLAAYDDRERVTAAFNLNLLARINRELEADFPLDRFVHESRWNEEASAVEMHLKSLDDRTVRIDGHRFDFAAGETIHSESSRKYSLEGFAAVAATSGWNVDQVWTDSRKRFAIVGLAPSDAEAARSRFSKGEGATCRDV